MNHDSFIDTAKSLIYDLTLQDIDTIMIHLGGSSHGDYVSNNTSIRASNPFVSYQTICHCGDSHSLKYFINKRLFFCYSHCRESLDIIGLVQKIKSCKMLEAMRWIADVVKYDLKGKMQHYSRLKSNIVNISDEESFYNDLRLMNKTINSNGSTNLVSNDTEIPQQLHIIGQQQ